MKSQILEQLKTDAYAEWNLGHLQEAAELFFAAEQEERMLASTRSPFAAPDTSFLYRARAAYCLWDDGQHDRARPILEEVAQFDWETARLWGDRRDYEKAFSRLLAEAATTGDRAGFTRGWARAVARGKELDMAFPQIVSEQRKLLQAALVLGDKDVCRHILNNLNPQLVAKHHELQLVQRQAEAFCCEP